MTVHRGDCPVITQVHERLGRHHSSEVASPQIVIVYLTVNALVDGFFPYLSDFDDRIDALEDDILKAPTEAQLGQLFDMKRTLMDMRKVIAPQRDMMASINAGVTDMPGMTDEATRYFRDLYDHLIRLADLVDSYRDLLSSVMDTHLSTVSNRLNVVMKQLTIIATIFLPLSFLTGFFGQNFAYLVRVWLAPTWTLLRARDRARARHRRLPRRAVPPPRLAGRADRLSHPRPTAAPGSGQSCPGDGLGGRRSGRGAVCTSYPVHQASQPSGTGKPSCLRRSTSARDPLLLLAHERERPGAVALPRVAGPQRLLEAPCLAAGLRDGVGALGDVGQDAGVALGQHVGGPQPPVVPVDAQQPGLHLEEADHVDHRVDRGQRGALGQAHGEVRQLPLGHADHAQWTRRPM